MFGADEPEESPTTQEDFNRLYNINRIQEKEKRVERAQPVAIDSIFPDPVQPRRAMPEDLRARWCTDASTVELFAEWEKIVKPAFPVHDWTRYVEGAKDENEMELSDLLPDTVLPPPVQQWVDLIRLAGSIWRSGLQQPVIIYPEKRGHRLLIGERRLLAFHFLKGLGYEGFAEIPAISRAAYDPLAQAVENGARQNLNAIGIARQLAILLMAMHDLEIVPSQMQQADQSWYARAIDLRTPYGRSEDLIRALGLPNIRVFQLYKQLLELPEEVWYWADQYNWTEGKLRDMTSRAEGNRDQLIAIAKAEATGESVEADNSTPSQQQALEDRVSRKAESVYTWMQKVVSMKDTEVHVLSQERRQQLIQAAQDVIRRLQE
jgi:hypothetical protein